MSEQTNTQTQPPRKPLRMSVDDFRVGAKPSKAMEGFVADMKRMAEEDAPFPPGYKAMRRINEDWSYVATQIVGGEYNPN